MRIPLSENELPQSNLVTSETGGAVPTLRTDDPQGRIRVPLSEKALPASNLETNP